MESWRRDSTYFLLGLSLALVFFGAVVTVGGLLFLLLSAVAPSSLRDPMQAISHPLQIGLLVISLFEVIAWNVLPWLGFVSQQLARRMALIMAAIMLFLSVSLLFSM